MRNLTNNDIPLGNFTVEFTQRGWAVFENYYDNGPKISQITPAFPGDAGKQKALAIAIANHNEV